MAIERPQVESADKVEAVQKLSWRISSGQGARILNVKSVYLFITLCMVQIFKSVMGWQISTSYKVPLPEQLEEKVGVYGAKQGVQAEID